MIVLEELTRQNKDAIRRVAALEAQEVTVVGSGTTVPATNAQNQMLISNATPAWSLLAAPMAENQMLIAGADPYTPIWAALAASLDYATPALTLSTNNMEGVADTVIRSDATILAFDATTPNIIQPDDAAATGSASIAARRDHEHGIVCAAAVDVGIANTEGTATSFARSDHGHNHPSGLGTNLHHNEIHVINSTGPHAEAGLTAGHVLRVSAAAAFAFAQLQHADLGGVSADQHHAQAHVVNSAGPHAETGLTIGHVLRATAAGAFSFGALQTGDIPQLDHGGLAGLADDDHTQYLNVTRHDTTTRHTLGTVVPHDALASLTEKAHNSLTGVTADQHHAQAHVVNSTGPHAETGLMAGHVLRASAAAAFAFAQLQHSDLGGVGTGDHHNEVHLVNSTGPHAESGLTIGHVLRASAAAAFGFAQLQHADLGGVTSDLHHAEAHVLATTGPHSGTLPWADLNKTGSDLADLATRAHSSLTGVTADQHHAQAHIINSTGPHAESGLTIGHVLRATGAAAFSFGALQAGDIPQLDHGGLAGLADDDHTQYLNTTRHDVTDRHTLGTVVPHDALASLTEKAHSSLTGVTADLHHSEVHVVNSSGPHTETGLTIGHVLRAMATDAFSFAELVVGDIPQLDHGGLTGLADDDHTQYLNTTRHDTTVRHTLGTVVPHDALASLTEKAHNSLTGITSNQHHAQAHVVDSTGPHTGAALTVGHVLRVSGATAFAFAQLQHSDLGGVTADLHHNEAHVLATSGPHTGTLPLTDLASYTRGSIARGGATGWEAYNAKTARNLLIGDGTDTVSRAMQALDLPVDTLGDTLFNAADGLLLLGPHGVITNTKWWSLRQQYAILSGAHRLVAGRWLGTHGLAVEPAGTNLCTNPVFGVGITGWAPGGSNTIARDTTVAKVSSASLKCTYQDNTWLAADPITMPAAGSYTLSAWVWVPYGYDGTNLRLLDNGFTGASRSIVHEWNTGDPTNQWVFIETVVTIVAGDLAGNFYLSVAVAPTAGKFVYFDAVQWEQSAYATSLIWGGAGIGYAWSGTAHQSTSIRTATEVNLDDLVSLISDNDTLSFSMWLQMPYDATYANWPHASIAYILAAYEDTQNYIALYYAPNTDDFRTVLETADVSVAIDSAAQTFKAGDWVHLVVTIDYAGDLKQYVNGVLDGEADLSALASTTPTEWNLGTSAAVLYPSGIVFDEFATLDRMLTANEVAALFALQRPLVDAGAFDKPVLVGDLYTQEIFFSGITDTNIVTVPDNLADALHLVDAGGIEYWRVISNDAQPTLIFNEGGADIDFRIEAAGVADALQVQGSDGQITLGALTAGFVKSSAGGVLSVSTDVALTELASYVQGALILGGGADWGVLAHPGAAGHALISSAAGVAWDQTPLWTGKHSFEAGIALVGASGVNEITIPDNINTALELLDAGGISYLGIRSTDTQPFVVFNEGGADVDFRWEASGQANALFVRGSDGRLGIHTNDPAGTVHVISTAVTNVHRPAYGTPALILDDGTMTAITLQLAARDYSTRMCHIVMTGAPTTGDNKHWVISGLGPDVSNRFSIGYLTSAATGFSTWGDVSEHFIISTGGDIGVGAVPGAKFDVAGLIRTTTGFRVTDGGAPGGAAGYITHTGEDLTAGDGGTTTLDFHANGTVTQATVDKWLKVYIGATAHYIPCFLPS